MGDNIKGPSIINPLPIPSGAGSPNTKPKPKNNGELWKLREEKLNKLRGMQASDLKWVRVGLQPTVSITSLFNFSPLSAIPSPVIIEVSEVVKVDGFYIPVTAEETVEFARQFDAFPLTRAVADQLFISGAQIPYQQQNQIKTGNSKSESGYDEMFDLEKQSDYLNGHAYDGVNKFGAHKLWILSKQKEVACPAYPKTDLACKSDKYAINHGFYERGVPKDFRSYLSQYGSKSKAVQDIGTRHDDKHWDYSQLLQLMRGCLPIPFREDSGLTAYVDLREALLRGHPSLWDEQPKKLDEADLEKFSKFYFAKSFFKNFW